MSAVPPWATSHDETVGAAGGRKRVAAPPAPGRQAEAAQAAKAGTPAGGSGSRTPPWASHYGSPGRQSPGTGAPGAAAGRAGSRGSSADVSHRPPAAAAESAVAASFLGDERAVAHGGSRQEHTAGSDGEWKRPRTLAPPWAAGGGQEMMLSSPAQGRKVSFVLSKPTFYNVEDAPSAVPTSTSERTWTAGARPITPAAPTVLRQPGGGTSSRPRTPAAPRHDGFAQQRPPTGRPSSERPPPRESVEPDGSAPYGVDDDARGGQYDGGYEPAGRAYTPAAATGSFDAGAGHADAARAGTASPGRDVSGDTPALQFVREAEAALRRPSAGAQRAEGSVDLSSYPGTPAMQAQSGGAHVAETAQWNTAPPSSGRGRDAYGVEKRGRTPQGPGRGGRGGGGDVGAGGRGSDRERAKVHYESATKTMTGLKEGGGGVRMKGAGGGQVRVGLSGVYVWLGVCVADVLV